MTGSQPIAFGADGAYWSTMSNGALTCSSGAVGVDPVYDVVKSCYSWTGPPPGFGTRCAAENDTCTFTGEQTIAYGADGDYRYKTFTGTANCTNAAFGADPLPNVAKSCYVVS